MEPVITIPALGDNYIYPGHDYTEENYEFALTIEPDNKVVVKYLQAVKEWQKQSKPAVPSNIGRERATNVFLRSDDPRIKAAINPDFLGTTDSEVFAELRRRKNIFG